MNDAQSKLPPAVTISVERMMRFCLLARMLGESAPGDTKVLKVHLTRFGVLLFETASFLYSLFEDRDDSLNLLNIWQDFNHPFGYDLQDFVTRLSPFKDELRLVRNRVGFHGSLNRNRERSGLGIFDVDSSRALNFIKLLIDVQHLFQRMIEWYIKGMGEIARPGEMWQEFVAELEGHSRVKRQA